MNKILIKNINKYKKLTKRRKQTEDVDNMLH